MSLPSMYTTVDAARVAAARHAEARRARLEQHALAGRQLEVVEARLAQLTRVLPITGEAWAAEFEELEREQLKLQTLLAQLEAHIARLYAAEQDALAVAEGLAVAQAAAAREALVARLAAARASYLDALAAVGGSPFASWILAQQMFPVSDLGWVVLLAAEHAPCLADEAAVLRTVELLNGWGSVREATALRLAWEAFSASSA